MSEAQVHGVTDDRDVAPSLITRDTRAIGLRIRAHFSEHGGVWVMAFGAASLTSPWLPLPPYPEFFALIGMLLWMFTGKLRPKFRLSTPKYLNADEDNGGLVWLGNAIDTKDSFWLNNDMLRTHMLVFGSTGSGKTILLLGLFYQAILSGSGAMFVDGKGDTSVFWMVYALARRLGREDDLLVINYLTPGVDGRSQAGARDGDRDFSRISNTTNPLADLSAEQARSQIVALMRSAGENEMWKGRASIMLGATLKYLCLRRDRGDLVLDVDVLRDAMSLDNLAMASFNSDVDNIPPEVIAPIKHYLSELPAFDYEAVKVSSQQATKGPPERAAARTGMPGSNVGMQNYMSRGDPHRRGGTPGTPPSEMPFDPRGGLGQSGVENADLPDRVTKIGKIPEESRKQHGYLQMQLTEVLGDLSDTYGHIFKTSHGEVDFRDVVFNRRLLFVMLPALQTDPDRLAGLGKMVVSGIRQALGPALGSDIEGSRQSVIEQKPTTAKEPFLLILDEYGSYAVEGFALVAAQARSLGVACVFAGQDYQSFSRASKTEAAATVANANVKIAMKLEDPKETFEVIRDRAGRANVGKTTGLEKTSGLSKYKDQKQIAYDHRDRIDLRDLVNQTVGQGHVIWRDMLVRMNLCYIAPEKIGEELQEAEVNTFLTVAAPDTEECNAIIAAAAQRRQVEEERQERFSIMDSVLLQDRELAQSSFAPANLGLIYSLGDMAIGRMMKASVFDCSRFAFGAALYRVHMSEEMDLDMVRDPARNPPAAAPLDPADSPQNEEILKDLMTSMEGAPNATPLSQGAAALQQAADYERGLQELPEKTADTEDPLALISTISATQDRFLSSIKSGKQHTPPSRAAAEAHARTIFGADLWDEQDDDEGEVVDSS